MAETVAKLRGRGVADEDIRRLFEAEPGAAMTQKEQKASSSELEGNAVSDHRNPVDLWKRYGAVEALRGLDLQVPTGSICGFLGKNGAGKTTAIKVLLGMARPDKGEARLLNAPPAMPPRVNRRASVSSVTRRISTTT